MLMFTGYVFWTLVDGNTLGLPTSAFFFCLMVSSPRASGCRRRRLYNNLVAMLNDAASY
jgi:hypothetical protein